MAFVGLRRGLPVVSRACQRLGQGRTNRCFSAQMKSVDEEGPAAPALELPEFTGIREGGVTVDFNEAMRAPDQHQTWPLLRLTDEFGAMLPGATPPALNDEQLVDMYKAMIALQEMDTVYYSSQRQGRISFYMTCSGEEALQVGSAAALHPNDPVFAQYREAGVIIWRGFSKQQFADQLFSNAGDLGKGRQMPVHVGSKELNFHTISSPLGTQIPQAAGAAYALKNQGSENLVICYFGEGAASEGDFHAGVNMASTLDVPMVFFCRNNGYAISTPTSDQYNGDGIVSRAAGYGLHGIRVDGNDMLAVYDATVKARELALAESKPVFIEAMTYRVGHHSTSDDSSRYRSVDEIKKWKEVHDPVVRFRHHLEDKGLWNADREAELRGQERLEILKALETAETKPKPDIEHLFTDVYDELPPHLVKQKQQLQEHLDKYGSHYQ